MPLYFFRKNQFLNQINTNKMVAQDEVLTAEHKQAIAVELDALSMVFKFQRQDLLNLSDYNSFRTAQAFEEHYDMQLTDALWLDAVDFIKSSVAYFAEKAEIAEGGI